MDFWKICAKRLEQSHHALVVVAEGAGQELMDQLPAQKDNSGNKRYGDIGVYLKEQIISYFKKVNVPTEVKYLLKLFLSAVFRRMSMMRFSAINLRAMRFMRQWPEKPKWSSVFLTGHLLIFRLRWLSVRKKRSIRKEFCGWVSLLSTGQAAS